MPPKIATFFLKQYLLKVKYLDLDNYLNMSKPDYVIHPTVLDGIYCNDLTVFSKKYKFKTIGKNAEVRTTDARGAHARAG